MPLSGVKVQMGRVLDGVSEHMQEYDEDVRFVVSQQQEPDQRQVTEILKSSGAEMLLNYLPVGSEAATRFYAQCALDAGIALVNNMPVFIASNPEWAKKFEEKIFL